MSRGSWYFRQVSLSEVSPRGAQRQRSGGARASGGTNCHPPRPARSPSVSLVFLQRVLFSSLPGGVLPQVRRVSLADRCRRVEMCQTRSSCTSSYPDSWDQTQRPICLACLTAATGESVPSNARVGLRPTSSSHGQDSPGRKGSHAWSSGSGLRQRVVKA